MTKVSIEADGNRRILSARGHATGSVECCAAISGLLYALVGYLENAALEEDIDYCARRVNDGDVFLDLTGGRRAGIAFDMAACGLLQIEKQYPQFIQVDVCDCS